MTGGSGEVPLEGLELELAHLVGASFKEKGRYTTLLPPEEGAGAEHRRA